MAKRAITGYKAFAVVDCDEGYIQDVRVRPANVAEVKELASLASGLSGGRLSADKGDASDSNKQVFRDLGSKDGIMYRSYRGRPLSLREQAINGFISNLSYPE